MPACDTEDGNLAVAILSNMTNGDTRTMCESCLTAFAVAICEGAGLTVTNPNDDQPDQPPQSEAAPAPPADTLTPADEQAETEAAADLGDETSPAPPPAAGPAQDDQTGDAGSDAAPSRDAELPATAPF